MTEFANRFEIKIDIGILIPKLVQRPVKVVARPALEHELSFEPMPAQVEHKPALFQKPFDIYGRIKVALVPNTDPAGAVISGSRDRQPIVIRVHRRPPRNDPRSDRCANFKPKFEVRPVRLMFLDNESPFHAGIIHCAIYATQGKYQRNKRFRGGGIAESTSKEEKKH